MKIFLDIGAHEGEILAGVLDPKYAFDRIFAFEPVTRLHPGLERLSNGRPQINLLQYGLWDKDASLKIYSPGTLAGSVFAAHNDIDQSDFEICRFIRASTWFTENLKQEDEVFVKMNCEGAEAAILLDLLDSGELFKIKNVMIDFDVRKVKGAEDMQQKVLDQFADAGFHAYSLCDDVMKGPTAITRVQNWLNLSGARKKDIGSTSRQVLYWMKMTITGQRPGWWWELKHLIKSFTPLFILRFIGAQRN